MKKTKLKPSRLSVNREILRQLNLAEGIDIVGGLTEICSGYTQTCAGAAGTEPCRSK